MRREDFAVLAVCTGNLCRSPFAAGYLAKRFQDEGVWAEAFSRGLMALPGRRPPREAVRAAAAYGVDLSTHVAQPLLGPDLLRADIVWVMEKAQRDRLVRARPQARDKVALLSEPLDGQDIEDPMGKPLAVFERVYARIAECVDAWMPELVAMAREWAG